MAHLGSILPRILLPEKMKLKSRISEAASHRVGLFVNLVLEIRKCLQAPTRTPQLVSKVLRMPFFKGSGEPYPIRHELKPKLKDD